MKEYGNVIYAYKDKTKNKIVYVGQTVNLKNRDYDHVMQDPYNKKCREYNYPLSRGIRKYGKENYELLILESNLDKNELDNKEIYYIDYYDTYNNGYNQNTGGTHYTTYYKYNEDILNKIIHLLKDTNISYKDISENTGISLTHLFNINEGERRKRKDIEYPIRKDLLKHGQLLDKETVNLIIEDLKNMRLKQSDIAKKYNCQQTTISCINLGKKYYDNKIQYPIRDEKCFKKWEIVLSDEEKNEIVNLLLNTKIDYSDIAKQYKIKKRVITEINNGKLFHDDNLSYPIRKSAEKISDEQINNIKNLLISTKMSYNDIAKKCNVSSAYVKLINVGKARKEKDITYPLRIK